MTSAAVVTAVKMMETLPEYAQNQAVEHLRNFIAEMQDEQQWDKLFKKTQNKLMVAAKLARKEIAAGHAEPMDFNQL